MPESGVRVKSTKAPESFDRVRAAQQRYYDRKHGFNVSTIVLCRDMRQMGFSLAEIARALNEKGIRSRRGGQWHAMSVKRLIEGE